jgi:hypothetical protein
MPTREQVLSTTYSGILDHCQNFNQEDDVLALRKFYAAVQTIQISNDHRWTLTLYAWAIRLGAIHAKLLHIGTRCEEARPSWTLDRLCDKIATVIGNLPQNQTFGWPRRAQLSTINRDTLRGWKADAVINLAIVVAKTVNRGHINAEHKEDILSKICNIHGLGGPYCQKHLWGAILDVTEIESPDSEFLIMGSGSGHPHYAILRYHDINNTADLHGALKNWARTNSKRPLDRSPAKQSHPAYWRTHYVKARYTPHGSPPQYRRTKGMKPRSRARAAHTIGDEAEEPRTNRVHRREVSQEA